MRFGKFPIRRDSEGRMLCKWPPCPNLIPKGRVYFCSNPCAFEVRIRRDASFLRARTKERDHGVCAKCGIDTEQLKRILRFAREALGDLLLKDSDRYFANYYWFKQIMVTDLMGAHLWNGIESMCQWQADHIVEVADGGEPYLDNIQTLCLPCHKAKTKHSHKQRAQRQRTPLLELCAGNEAARVDA